MEVEEPIVEGRVIRPFCRAKVKIDVTKPDVGSLEPTCQNSGLFTGMSAYKIFASTVV